MRVGREEESETETSGETSIAGWVTRASVGFRQRESSTHGAWAGGGPQASAPCDLEVARA